MENGNWVPISKAFADSLPRTRKFTELEAIFSLQLDFDNDVEITISGCSGRWGWSRDKVRKFLADVWVMIEYDKDTKSFKKQKGKLKKTLTQQQIDIKPSLKKHKRFIDNSSLKGEKNIKPTLNQHKKNINHDTTIETNTKNNPKTKEYSEDSIEFRISLFLLNNIRKRKPDFKIPDLQKWSKHSDHLINLDRRDIEEIKSVIVWTQKDDFWQNNILSTAKLRKQYDQLALKMGKEKEPKKQQKSATLTAMPGAISV